MLSVFAFFLPRGRSVKSFDFEITWSDLAIDTLVSTMAPETSPTESSPLLGSVLASGPVSNGTIPNHHVESGGSVGTEERAKEPFPDAHKQLKYIVPAISLGV